MIQRESISSPEELQAALEAHPELQEALAQAAEGPERESLSIPPEFAQDVRELQAVQARLQREPHLAPRRVAILENMRARPAIEHYPKFKAAVFNDLSNAYSQLPTGDRGANLARAIECYQQALSVYTPEAWPERCLGTATSNWTDDVTRLTLDFRDDELTRLAKAAKDPHAEEQADRFRPQVSLPRHTLACVNVATLEKHPAVDEIVKSLLPRYSFRLVRVPCSLKPAEGSHIASASLELQIGRPDQSEPPLMFSIFPEQVTGSGSRTTEAVFEPSLKLKPDEVEASLGRVGRTVQVGQLRTASTPRIAPPGCSRPWTRRECVAHTRSWSSFSGRARSCRCPSSSAPAPRWKPASLASSAPANWPISTMPSTPAPAATNAGCDCSGSF